MSFSDNLDNEVKLARSVKRAGYLPEADDFPVDGAKVEEILGKLARLDTRRLVATNRANFVRLEVGDADFRRRIKPGKRVMTSAETLSWGQWRRRYRLRAARRRRSMFTSPSGSTPGSCPRRYRPGWTRVM